jgi:hypothetical protein
MLGQVGTGIVLAARENRGVNGFDNPYFSILADEVRTIALQMLQNPLLRSRIQVNPPAATTYTTNSANNAIYEIHAQGEKRGGKRTRKHKKRRKKTRHRRKRGKKTRHKKKKRTRKH